MTTDDVLDLGDDMTSAEVFTLVDGYGPARRVLEPIVFALASTGLHAIAIRELIVRIVQLPARLGCASISKVDR